MMVFILILQYAETPTIPVKPMTPGVALLGRGCLFFTSSLTTKGCPSMARAGYAIAGF